MAKLTASTADLLSSKQNLWRYHGKVLSSRDLEEVKCKGADPRYHLPSLSPQGHKVTGTEGFSLCLEASRTDSEEL